MSDITIIMPSWNKEQYIAEALDSIFMQQTTYDYHIIVADDCSTDKTVEIVKQYQERHPNKITLLTSEKNQKLYKNVLRAYEITKTDYFCVLDPDDYWIDEHKIQKSLDFMENNKEFTIYVTDTDLLTKEGKIEPFIKRNKVVNSSFKDFLDNKAELGCTLGSTFRNVIFKNGIPPLMKDLPSDTATQSFRGDTFRSVIHLYYGKAHCVPEVDAIYRATNEGLWQGSSTLKQNLLNATIFKDLWLYFEKKHPELLVKSHYFYNLINHNLCEQLGELQNGDKLALTIKKINDLSTFYKRNQDVFNKFELCHLPLKTKLRLIIYKKLQKKLMSKGLI